MNKHKKIFSHGRRQMLLGLVGVAVAGCSFDGANSNTNTTSQGATPQSTLSAATPTATTAPGTMLTVYRGHAFGVTDLAWSPDSKYIVSCGSGSMSQVYTTPPAIHIWDATTGKENNLNHHGLSDAQPPLAWSPDGKWIATTLLPDASGSQQVRLWNTQTYSSHGSFQSKNNFISQVTWSPDNSKLAVAGYHAVEIFDSQTMHLILTYPASLSSQESQQSPVVAWSPDGKTIASAAAKTGHSLQFWNANTGKPLHYFSGIMPTVAVWAPDGKTIATGSAYGQPPQVLDWNTGQTLLATQAQLPLLPGFEQTVKGGALPHTISWSPDGKYIVIADHRNQAQIWNVSSQRQVYAYSKHSGPVLAVAWSPDGSRIASASYDKTVHVWQAL